MNSDSPAFQFKKPVFLFGMTFFFVVKMLLIVVPTIPSAMPRVGDDSYYYFWKAVLNGHNYSRELPAVADIKSESEVDGESVVVSNPGLQTDNARNNSEIGAIWRTRIRHRTFDTHGYFYDLMNRQIIATGLPLKWACATSEVVILIIFTAGLALFLNVLFGPLGASLSLVFLSLAESGLYIFLSGLGSLGLALLLYSYLLVKGKTFSFAVIIPFVVLMLGVHSISKVYVITAIGVHVASLPTLKEAFNRRSFLLGFALAGLTVGYMLLPSLAPGMARFLTISSAGDLGHLANFSELVLNLRQSWELIITSPANLYLPLAGGIAGAVLCLKYEEMRPALLVLVLGLGLVAVSPFYAFLGYKAIIFGRFSTFLYLVLFGFAAWLLMKGVALKNQFFTIGIGLLAAFIAFNGARTTYKFAISNLNKRPQIVKEEVLVDQYARLPDGTVVMYLEPEIALLPSLISGSYRHGAIVVHNYIDNHDGLVKAIQYRQPKVAVIPNFGPLNMLAHFSSWGLIQRRHGIPFSHVKSLMVSLRQDQLLDTLHLFVRNPGDAFILTAISADKEAQYSGPKPSMEVPAGFAGWLQFRGDLRAFYGVKIALPAGQAWIEGVSLERPRPHLFWPWRRKALVGVLRRGQETGRYKFLEFSTERLLERLGGLRDFIRKNDPVLSDDSGLVFMKTVFDPN